MQGEKEMGERLNEMGEALAATEAAKGACKFLMFKNCPGGSRAPMPGWRQLSGCVAVV